MFKKATKQQCKLRLAIFGPSGSGKTFSALRIARGMGGKIAVIDTESGSASKYADRFDFDDVKLKQKTIEDYTKCMACAHEYDILIIDSLSHAWQELLSDVDRLAKSKYKGNTWSAWGDGTPKQKKLVNAILSFPGHIIATMRSKTEWTTGDMGNGKSQPIRVGLAPEQGKGIEYEFDILMELSTEHIVEIIKDRTGKFQDKIIEKPGEELGKELIDWLGDGEKPVTENKDVDTKLSDKKPSDPTVKRMAEWLFAEANENANVALKTLVAKQNNNNLPIKRLELLDEKEIIALWEVVKLDVEKFEGLTATPEVPTDADASPATKNKSLIERMANWIFAEAKGVANTSVKILATVQKSNNLSVKKLEHLDEKEINLLWAVVKKDVEEYEKAMTATDEGLAELDAAVPQYEKTTEPTQE